MLHSSGYALFELVCRRHQALPALLPAWASCAGLRRRHVLDYVFAGDSARRMRQPDAANDLQPRGAPDVVSKLVESMPMTAVSAARSQKIWSRPMTVRMKAVTSAPSAKTAATAFRLSSALLLPVQHAQNRVRLRHSRRMEHQWEEAHDIPRGRGRGVAKNWRPRGRQPLA